MIKHASVTFDTPATTFGEGFFDKTHMGRDIKNTFPIFFKPGGLKALGNQALDTIINGLFEHLPLTLPEFIIIPDHHFYDDIRPVKEEIVLNRDSSKS